MHVLKEDHIIKMHVLSNMNKSNFKIRLIITLYIHCICFVFQEIQKLPLKNTLFINCNKRTDEEKT